VSAPEHTGTECTRFWLLARRRFQPPFRQELVHADGKTERAYGDGRREVTFANGTLRLQLPDGRAVVRFTNGDVKKAFPCGARAGLGVGVFRTRRSGADACVSARARRVAGRAGGPAGLRRALPRACRAAQSAAAGRRPQRATASGSPAPRRKRPGADSLVTLRHGGGRARPALRGAGSARVRRTSRPAIARSLH